MSVSDAFDILLEKLIAVDKKAKIKTVNYSFKGETETLKQHGTRENLQELITQISSLYNNWKGLGLDHEEKPDVYQRTNYTFDHKRNRLIIETKKEDLTDIKYINYVKYDDFEKIIVRLLEHFQKASQVKTIELIKKENINYRIKVDRVFRVLIQKAFLVRHPSNKTLYLFASPDAPDHILSWLKKENEHLFTNILNRLDH